MFDWVFQCLPGCFSVCVGVSVFDWVFQPLPGCFSVWLGKAKEAPVAMVPDPPSVCGFLVFIPCDKMGNVH